ncbi:MAG: class I SAM-dependent methyltransferase [Gemmatimonadota bacterium]|nr:class I SAM-dependent methyltransferase [Gemmatimonadota bacterium]
MGRTNKITAELAQYIADVGVREHPVLARCRHETHEVQGDLARMQISPEQGAFLGILARLLGARRTLEVGVFTGYSSLSVALALADGGSVTACEMSEEYAGIAEDYWVEAGVRDRIDLRMGPARRTLDRLIADGESGHYDLAFIDADKTRYDDYYERCLELVRTGGVVAVDNTLWDGAVIDDEDQSADTVAIRSLNVKIHADDRVETVLTTIGDGLTICLKRG